MNLEEQQALYSELEKFLQEKCGENEFYMILSVEAGQKGDGKCVNFKITSLNDKKPLGTWKGIYFGIRKRVSDLTDNFSDITAFGESVPFEPKE